MGNDGVKEFCQSRGISMAEFGVIIGVPVYERSTHPSNRSPSTYKVSGISYRTKEGRWTLQEFMKLRIKFRLSDIEAAKILLGRWEGVNHDAKQKMRNMREGVYPEEKDTEVLQS